ncbi:hypothetical protein GCM10020219_054050 [Nonomuraea dietziae]
MRAHLAVPLEAEPVGPVLDLADVADRSATHPVRQLEDLGDSEYRAFLRALVTCPARGGRGAIHGR